MASYNTIASTAAPRLAEQISTETSHRMDRGFRIFSEGQTTN